jgi:multidrug efflux pump
VLSLQNTNLARGQITDGNVSADIVVNGQISHAADYQPLIVGYKNGAAVRLSDVADVIDSVQNVRAGGYLNGKRAVTLVIFRQPGANIIDTVDRIYAQLPSLKASIPGHRHDRGDGPHDDHPASVSDGRTHAADLDWAGDPGGVCISAQSAGDADSRGRGAHIADRHVRGDVSVRLQPGQPFADGADHLDGFVVDDAIVVMENISRHIEDGMEPFAATLRGAKEIGFTVMTISMSLIAVFIPLL